MSEPASPTLNPPAAKNSFQTIARASWIAPLMGLGVNFVLVMTSEGRPGPATALIGIVFMGGGLLLGIVALFGMLKYGRKGILIPALIGIAIPVALALLALPNFYAAKARAQGHQPPEAAVHSAAARLLQDERLRLSMDIPQGFVDWPEGKQAANVEHCFVRELPDAGGARLVVNVQRLGGRIPHVPLRPEDAMKHAPPGVKLNLVQKNWRGFKVDTIVSETMQGGMAFVVYGAQIPLLPSAIQINVGGPMSHRAEVERLTDEVIASIEGATNW